MHRLLADTILHTTVALKKQAFGCFPPSLARVAELNSLRLTPAKMRKVIDIFLQKVDVNQYENDDFSSDEFYDVDDGQCEDAQIKEDEDNKLVSTESLAEFYDAEDGLDANAQTQGENDEYECDEHESGEAAEASMTTGLQTIGRVDLLEAR